MHIYIHTYIHIYLSVYLCVCMCVCIIMKTMCLSRYHHSGFVATYALMDLGTSVHHVPKCMNCHKAIVVISGKVHCFHDYIYIMPILLL